MTKETSIKLFESKKIRVHWDNEPEKRYFSVIDISTICYAYMQAAGMVNDHFVECFRYEELTKKK